MGIGRLHERREKLEQEVSFVTMMILLVSQHNCAQVSIHIGAAQRSNARSHGNRRQC
jgi:hypothetical protein